VFAQTLSVQVRKFSPNAEVGVVFSAGEDSLFYKATINLRLNGVELAGCFSIEGVLGSGVYSVEIFAESSGTIALGGLNMELAVRVAALIRSRL
jgi:hypothetical protein